MKPFEERRRFLRDRMFELSEPGPLNLTLPLLRLELNEDTLLANQELRHIAGWFDRPHPTGRDLRGECDFAAEKLALAVLRFGERLLPDTAAAIERFFTEFDFSSIYLSENHFFLFHTARYLAAGIWEEKMFRAYGRSGRELRELDRELLARFIRCRARRGWGEFDSCCYIIPDWECLTLLYDHSGDAELSALSEKMLNVLLADLFQESPDGCWGGAHGRIYPPHALDYACCDSGFLAYLYGGKGSCDRLPVGCFEAVASSFVPMPEVAAMADWEPVKPQVIKERKLLHNTCDILPEKPLDGSICKYTLRTPNYIIGSVVRQDDYPDEESRGYAMHQQHDWDVFLRGGTTRSRIFSHHPGDFNEHNDWTGDLDCRCGKFFQHRSAVLALYDIPAGQPKEYIHAYLPKMEFLDVVETPEAIFVSTPMAYAALIIPEPWHWTMDETYVDREIVIPGTVCAVICEAADAADYSSFREFQEEILENSWNFDREARQLTYVSARCGAMELCGDGRRWVDGAPAEFDYPLYESPLINSAWDSGIYTFTVPGFEPVTVEF